MVFITKDEGTKLVGKILTGGKSLEAVDIGEEVEINPAQIVSDYTPAELTPDQLKSVEIMGTHDDSTSFTRKVIGSLNHGQVNEENN